MARFTISIAAFFATVLGVTVAEDISYCGTSPYLPSQYTCYDGDFLCPILNGVATQRCGDACYTEYQYTCTSNATLSTLPYASGPLELTAIHPGLPWNGARINAAGRHFWIGGNAAVYCPTVVGATCATFPNTTIVYSSGMAVMVPGGQQTYIEADGAYGFTQAHSMSVPPGASVGGTGGFENGLFTAPAAEGWLACPNGSGSLQVFAKLSGVSYAQNCTGLFITNRRSGYSFGAWQYT